MGSAQLPHIGDGQRHHDTHRRAWGGGTAIYVNCQTNLVDTFRAHYPALEYEGVRALVLGPDDALPEPALRHIIALSLTYHARKKPRRRAVAPA